MRLEARVAEAHRLLATIEKDHSPAALASSFGAEDMVLLDLIAHEGHRIEIFTIDTGRLPGETHALIREVRARYLLPIAIYSPWPESVDAYVEEHGIDGFYGSVPARRACCALRKVEPLARALAGRRAWITGLRRAQAESRASVALAARDEARGLWKFNPLAEWSDEDVWRYLRENRVPCNALHERGYPSIGCAPCTRAVSPGEHPRAGRWWWEQEGAKKECGLHVIPIRAAA
jgi:phosphoadenosine phosphosulfate reductase